jgi:sugar/nucleoside kinase (ribokinase family)
MNRIVCFGEALIDFLAMPPGDPRQPRAFLQHAGGAPANVAVALARLGSHAEFVGMLGMDMFGDFLLESLRREGVHVGHVQRLPSSRSTRTASAASVSTARLQPTCCSARRCWRKAHSRERASSMPAPIP